MGRETEYETETREGPGEIRGDTERLFFFFNFGWGGGVSLPFFFFVWLVCTNQKLRKKGKKNDNVSHVANTGGETKNRLSQPPSRPKIGDLQIAVFRKKNNDELLVLHCKPETIEERKHISEKIRS